MLHQAFGRDRGVVHVGTAGGENFAEIMRRDVRRHADRDAAGAVDEQVREAGREDLRLTLRRIVVRREVDRVLVDVGEQEVRNLGQARFRVPHGGGRIGIHRPEIALAIDQGDAQRPGLHHAGECVVDRAVAVRVILTHDVTHDAARLAVGPSGDVAGLLAGVENTAVDRLQAVAHVGQRAADDHAHRVIEVAGLHFVDDGDRSDVAAVGRARKFGGRFGGQVW